VGRNGEEREEIIIPGHLAEEWPTLSQTERVGHPRRYPKRVPPTTALEPIVDHKALLY